MRLGGQLGTCSSGTGSQQWLRRPLPETGFQQGCQRPGRWCPALGGPLGGSGGVPVCLAVCLGRGLANEPHVCRQGARGPEMGCHLLSHAASLFLAPDPAGPPGSLLNPAPGSEQPEGNCRLPYPNPGFGSLNKLTVSRGAGRARGLPARTRRLHVGPGLSHSHSRGDSEAGGLSLPGLPSPQQAAEVGEGLPVSGRLFTKRRPWTRRLPWPSSPAGGGLGVWEV